MSHPNTRRKTTIPAMIGTAALLWTATPAMAGDLKIGISQYPSTLHPMFDAMVAKSLVLGTALRSVTTHDADWKPVCQLCTELPTFENGRAQYVTTKSGKKGIAARYTIRDDAFWSDGTPVTGNDIIFSRKVGMHPQSGVGNGSFFSEDIEEIILDGDRNFTIIFSKEICEFASIADFYPLPAHLEEKIFDQDPATYMSKTLYVTAPATAGLYWGPYQIEKTDTGSRIDLGKNPHWKGKTPAFDKITFRTIENVQALSANLLSGEVDYIAGELGLSLDQAVALEKRLPQGKFNVSYKPSLTYEHIDLNLDRAPFDDKRVRQALLHAINRAVINDTIFGGKQPPAESGINPLDTVFKKDVKPYPYDPAIAEKLLEEAGFNRNDQGILVGRDKKPLTIVLSTTAGNKTRETILQAIQADWKKIGIDAVIRNEPARVLFGDTMRERKFEGGIMYAWMSAPRNIPKTTLHSTMVPSADNNYAGQNYPGYRSDKMDGILDRLEITCAEKENLALWHDLQDLYAEDLPALPLYYRADPFIMPVWLQGVRPTGHMGPSTQRIEDWEDRR